MGTKADDRIGPIIKIMEPLASTIKKSLVSKKSKTINVIVSDILFESLKLPKPLKILNL